MALDYQIRGGVGFVAQLQLRSKGLHGQIPFLPLLLSQKAAAQNALFGIIHLPSVLSPCLLISTQLQGGEINPFSSIGLSPPREPQERFQFSPKPKEAQGTQAPIPKKGRSCGLKLAWKRALGLSPGTWVEAGCENQ